MVLTGAAAALGPTPDMLAYGISKAAVHHMVRSLSLSMIPVRVRGVLPVTILTQSNRLAMPSADISTWTPATVIADEIIRWAHDSKLSSSGLFTFRTLKGCTTVAEVYYYYLFFENLYF